MAEKSLSAGENRAISASEVVSNVSPDESEILEAMNVCQQKRRLRFSEVLVRQQTTRMLMHDYGILSKDIAFDFPVRIRGKRRKLDIVVFRRDEPHAESSVCRIVCCASAEKHTVKRTTKLRDFHQAEKDLQALKLLMNEIPSCTHGLWTNGLERFFLEKQIFAGEIQMNPLSDWPPVGSISPEPGGFPTIPTHKADPELLQITLQRCKRWLHDNEGMPGTAMFWQLCYLFFCKIYDENAEPNKRRFWAGFQERFEVVGQKQIRERILSLFQDVKKHYRTTFGGNEEITLSDYALAFTVSELARYNLASSSTDAKEIAFQEIAEPVFRAGREQILTHRSIVQFLVAMLDPEEQERVFDPSCGTGTFLVETQRYLAEKYTQRRVTTSHKECDVFPKQTYVTSSRWQVFGADVDFFFVRVAQMHMALFGDEEGKLYDMNPLTIETPERELHFGTFDVLVTNPLRRGNISITDSNLLNRFELAHIWKRRNDGSFTKTDDLHKSTPVEILFLERSLAWLKPGGRLGMVLPTTILGSSLYEYVRWWILQKAWICAIVDFPVEAVRTGSHARVLASSFFLQKKTTDDIRREISQGETVYPVFVAQAEAVGTDRRGNWPSRDLPEEKKSSRETNGEQVHRAKRSLANDLPAIAQRYKEFLIQQINSDHPPYAARKE